MARGVLCAVVCPMLEDELIFSLRHDPEPKRVVVLDGDHNGSFKRKMRANGVGFEEMDEWTFMNSDPGFDRGEFNIVVRMMSLALHAQPRDLMARLQDDLTMLQGRVDAAALYYGMCGNAGWDISKWAEENLDFPVSVFRDAEGRVIDDCVGVAVGGVDGYRRLLRSYTGVMLFTPCIATNWEDFLGASDMAQGLESIFGPGDRRAGLKWIFEQVGYDSVVQIDTGFEPREDFDAATKEFADYMDFKVLQAPDDFLCRDSIARLYDESKSFLA